MVDLIYDQKIRMPAKNLFFLLPCKVCPTLFKPSRSTSLAGANVIEPTIIKSWRCRIRKLTQRSMDGKMLTMSNKLFR
jgi:hypothetical protein